MPNAGQFQPQICYNLSAVIASSDTTGAEVDLVGTQLVGFIMPAAITGTSITITMSDDTGGTFVTVQDGAGADLSFAVAASKYIPIPSLALTTGLRYIKIVSNASEGAQRTIKLVTRQV